MVKEWGKLAWMFYWRLKIISILTNLVPAPLLIALVAASVMVFVLKKSVMTWPIKHLLTERGTPIYDYRDRPFTAGRNKYSAAAAGFDDSLAGPTASNSAPLPPPKLTEGTDHGTMPAEAKPLTAALNVSGAIRGFHKYWGKAPKGKSAIPIDALFYRQGHLFAMKFIDWGTDKIIYKNNQFRGVSPATAAETKLGFSAPFEAFKASAEQVRKSVGGPPNQLEVLLLLVPHNGAYPQVDGAARTRLASLGIGIKQIDAMAYDLAEVANAAAFDYNVETYEKLNRLA